MGIFRALKNINPISQHLYSILINSLEIQIILTILFTQEFTFFSNIVWVTHIYSSNSIKIGIILNFILNILTIIYLLVYQFFITDSKNNCSKFIFKIITIKPYALFIQIITINVLIFKNFQVIYAVIAGFNIFYALGEIFLLQNLNKSYRFEETNFIKRKNSSLILWLLILPILISVHFIGDIYGCFFLIVRSTLQLYFNSKNLQNQPTRFAEYFYPLLAFQATAIVLTNEYFSNSLSSLVFFEVFLIVFTTYCCLELTSNLILTNIKNHLTKTQTFIRSQFQQENNEQQASNSLKEQQLQNYLLILRILVKIYHYKKNVSQNQNKSEKFRSFDNWWIYFNRTIITHRLYCSKVTCICNKLIKRSKQNSQVQQKVFIQTIFKCLKRMIKRSSSKNIDLSIIQKYFFIQIYKLPLKTYYQLIKLNKNVQTNQHILQMEILIKQSRQVFERVFVKQKVQNQTLQIQPILQFQSQLTEMKKKLTYFAVQHKKFYQFFSNSLLEIKLVKQFSNKLLVQKDQFKLQIDQHLQKFDRNLQFLTLTLVYYKYFDEYTTKIPKIQLKIKSIMQFHLSGQKNQHRNIDIFDPQYGAIKIDLVFNPGKVISATKNICSLLGYKLQQVAGHRINKVMPYIFSQYHDTFISNFIQKGSFNMLKRKDRIFYAKNSKKFLFPITVRIRVEYMSQQTFYASSLIKKTPTKSNFILMNNYGKIEQISQVLYKLLFQKALRQQISKIKRLNVYKMLLSLNHFIKSVGQDDDRVYQGIIMTSQNQQQLFSYYKTIQSLKNYKQNNEQFTDKTIKQGSTKSKKSIKSFQGTSYSQTRNSLDVSQDVIKFQTDIKESLKQFIKLVNLNKIKAYKISFKFYDLITSQFKCKILEVTNVNYQLKREQIVKEITKEIVDVGELYDLPSEIYQKYKKNFMQMTQKSQIYNDIIQSSYHPGLSNQKFSGLRLQDNQISNSQSSLVCSQQINSNEVRRVIQLKSPSQASSMISVSQQSQKKASIIAIFQKKQQQKEYLEIFLTVLIILMGLTLIIICIFSIRLRPDYQKLQNDNQIISNFQINFQFRLAVQQLYHFYHPFHLQPPEFLVSKKHLLTDNMKQQLQNSISKIDQKLSGGYYQEKITLIHADSGFQETRSILATLAQIYSMFLLNQELGEHLSDNYIVLSSRLMSLVQIQKQLVLEQSQSFIIKIHIVIALYLLFLTSLIILMLYLNHLYSQKQNRIIDFLPFMNSKTAKKNIIFYQSLSEYFKETQIIETYYIQQLQTGQFDKTATIYNANLAQNQQPKQMNTQRKIIQNIVKIRLQETNNQKNLNNNANTRLIRIVKSTQKLLTTKNIIFGLIILIICFTVVFETQYFFSEANTKFQTYINLKFQSMFVQNIPPRLILLHLINTHDLILREQPNHFTEQFFHYGHQQTFSLRLDISKNGVFGSQMQKNISNHFNSNICTLIECQQPISDAVENQDIYYMTYRFENAFLYLRKIYNILLTSPDAMVQLRQWLQQNNVLQILHATQYILQLMRQNQIQLSSLFTKQLNQIQYIILFLSLTLIPLLIIIMLFIRNKFLKYISERLIATENVYKQLKWNMLSENTYAINYFEDKVKNAKKM